MRRNLKTLGLALVAVFALSAVAASAASAESLFTSGSEETTLTAKAKTTQVFKEEGLEVSCTEVTIDTHEKIKNSNTKITVEPTYSKCKITAGGLGEGLEAQVDTNGCDYTFTANATVHLDCSTAEGKSIEVTVFLLGKFRKCLDIGTQSNLAVDYTNTTEVTGGKNVWDVDVKSTAKNIIFSKTGSCGEGEFKKAEYTGEVTVWGEDGAGNPVDVTWDP